MKDRFRTYQYFLLGALGGLLGWFAAALLLHAATQTSTAYGLLLGAFIGLCLAAREGLTAGSVRRFLRFGSVSLACGALAGAAALWLAQKLYAALLGTQQGFSLKAFLLGTSCWVLLGGVIGFGETLHKGTESWKGVLGGAIGGCAGGLLCELSRAVATTNAHTGGQAMLAFSMMSLGGATGAAIAFVVSTLQRAWLEVTNGKHAGRTFDVTKFVANTLGKPLAGLIGSDEWNCHVYLSGDCAILPQHATIALLDGQPVLNVLPAARKHGLTLVNGERITRCALRDGDRIQIGALEMIYRQKRRRA